MRSFKRTFPKSHIHTHTRDFMPNTKTNSANSANGVQTALADVRDWSEPQVISAQRLARTITEAASAGFEAIRLEVWRRPFGYRVTFQRMETASEGRGARPVDSGAMR